MKRVIANIALLAVLQGCQSADTRVQPRETIRLEDTATSTYTLERLRATAALVQNENGRWGHSLVLHGIARDPSPKGTPRRIKNLLRVERITYKDSNTPLYLSQEQLASQSIDPILQFDAYTRDSGVFALEGQLSGLDEHLQPLCIEGHAVIYEADEIGTRRLDIQEAILDSAMVNVSPGVYVGVSEFAQQESECEITIRYWVARTITNGRGHTELSDPVVPLSVSPSSNSLMSEMLFTEQIGKLPSGWKHADSAAPDLIEFVFLDEAGKTIHKEAENGLLVEYELGWFGEMAIGFKAEPGSRVVEIMPVVVTKQRLVEVPFTVDAVLGQGDRTQ